MHKKVMLAYTGGLQSSVCLHWLARRGIRVTALILELGPGSQSGELGERAVKLGAFGAHVEDCRERFIKEYAFRALRASAVQERRCLLSDALARPLIAEVLAGRAAEEGYKCLAMGTYSASDDAARFRESVRLLSPQLDIFKPDQVPPLRSRAAAAGYAGKNEIALLHGGADSMLSYDVNLWGAVAALPPELGTWEPAPEKYYSLTAAPEDAAREPEFVTIDFEAGCPVSVDGKRLAPHKLVEQLNVRAGRHGAGRGEVVEDRLSGQKSRDIYEAPGAGVLMEAHSALEEICLEYETLQAKAEIGRFYANLVYKGGWFRPLRKAYDAFVDATQEHVNGSVRLKLYRGGITVTGRSSPDSLFGGTAGEESDCPRDMPDL